MQKILPTQNVQKNDLPSPYLALIPIVTLMGLLFFTIQIFGGDTLDGASQIALLLATAVGAVIAMTRCNTTWKMIENAVVQHITNVAPALLILLLIGALAGSWMVSGVIPTMIYYGVKIIQPEVFLASTCVICALVSVMTGSSWTTVATIGIAFAGVGKVQGFHEGWIAGAILSGAYFGDKISPLSDTTVLASSVTETPLFQHIKYMMITTVPSITITLIIFITVGLFNEITPQHNINDFAVALNENYNISLWLLIVPAFMGILIVKKVPPLITLFLSSVVAAGVAVVAQTEVVGQVAGMEEQGGEALFKGAVQALCGHTEMKTGNEVLDKLTETRGMKGMMNTIWLIICAMCFGGTMAAGKMIQSITNVFIHFIKHRTSLVASTALSGIFINLCAADQYLSILLTGNMFKNVYKKQGFESKLLSRTVEDSATVTSPLIPWNTCGMTQATVLQINTLTYLPYCFFNLISPVMSILVAFVGYKIKKIPNNEEN